MLIHKLISKYNHDAGDISRIKYIVIHYVGALGGAQENAKYFAGGNRHASAHYFVGHKGEVWQSVEDKNIAWHCGNPTYIHPECRNKNSIGIEMCCRQDKDGTWYFEDATVAATIKLVTHLQNKYAIPVKNVIRHYDVMGKICPAPYVKNNTKHTWDAFKAKLKDPKRLTISTKLSDKTSFTQDQNQTANKSKSLSTEEIIWTFFSSKGFTDYAIAGLMGNLQAESGLKPKNLQNSFEKSLGMTDDEYTLAVDNLVYPNFVNDGAGYGLAQWTFPSRKQNLLSFIRQSSFPSIGDLNGQLEFLYKELTTSYSGLVKDLNNAKSVYEASTLVLTKFERPKDQSDKVKDTRAAYSQGFYNKYSGSTVTIFAKPVPFMVKVNVKDLNIRKGPGSNYPSVGYTGIGVFTILEVQNGTWGKLKSGSGWINLNFVQEV